MQRHPLLRITYIGTTFDFLMRAGEGMPIWREDEVSGNFIRAAIDKLLLELKQFNFHVTCVPLLAKWRAFEKPWTTQNRMTA